MFEKSGITPGKNELGSGITGAGAGVGVNTGSGITGAGVGAATCLAGAELLRLEKIH